MQDPSCPIRHGGSSIELVLKRFPTQRSESVEVSVEGGWNRYLIHRVLQRLAELSILIRIYETVEAVPRGRMAEGHKGCSLVN